MIKAIVFDLDNTLYDYDAAHALAFQAVTDYAGRTFGLKAEEFAALHKQGDRLLRERIGSVTASIHNRLLRYQVMLEETGQPVSHAPRMAELYWSVFLNVMAPYPGLKECMAELKSCGYTVGIGTNMTAEYQFAKLRRLGILEDMDFIVSSEETGAEKPDRKLFDCCFKKPGCEAGECLFVGDSLEKDAKGAQTAGMVPVGLCAEPREGGVRRIASLAELPALVRSL